MKLALVFLLGMLIGAIGTAGFFISENGTIVHEAQLIQLYCESCLGPWD